MAQLVVFGAGDIARLAHYYFSHDSEHEVVAFCVDAAYRDTSEFLGLPVVNFEDVSQHYPAQSYKMFVALSYARLNQVRAEKYQAAKALGYELVSYVSSHCTFLSQYPVGDNCFVLEDNTIQPYVHIGNNVTLWSGNHIGHDSSIDDHCFIASHVVISGNCHIGAFSFIGVNATISNSLRIAERCVIGAGAVVMKDTAANGVYLPRQTKLYSTKSEDIDL